MIDKQFYQEVVTESTPGMFESEKPETAYYWEKLLNGESDDSIYCSEFEVYSQ